MNRKACTISILAAGAFWGCISLFLKPLGALGLTSIQIVFLRTFVSFLMMAGYLALKNPSLLRLRAKDIPLFFGTGILSHLFFSLFYYAAIDASGVSVAVVLLYTSPVFVVLLSALVFREPLTKRKLLALAMTILGCVLVAGVLSSGEAIGGHAIALGLGAGFCYALYSIFSRIALRRCDTMTITVYTFAFAAAGSGIGCLLDRGGAPLSVVLSPSGVLLVLGIALFCCVLPYLLYTRGLTGVETGHAAILATVEPVVGSVIGIVLFSEPLTAMKLLGMVLVLSSVLVLSKED